MGFNGLSKYTAWRTWINSAQQQSFPRRSAAMFTVITVFNDHIHLASNE